MIPCTVREKESTTVGTIMLNMNDIILPPLFGYYTTKLNKNESIGKKNKVSEPRGGTVSIA